MSVSARSSLERMTSNLIRLVGRVNDTSDSIVDASSAGSKSHVTQCHRILCFGDSLTEGYVARGTIMHPYARALLRTMHTRQLTCSIDESGISGQLTAPMVARLGAILAAAKAQGHPYSWVIILGGTNDLCNNVPQEQILMQLHAMHSMCQSHTPTCRSIALTIPDIQAHNPADEANRDPRDRMPQSITFINEALMKKFSSTLGSRYSSVDLRSAIPQWDYADKDKNQGPLLHDPHKLWDFDFVHYSVKGYDAIGELVAKEILRVEQPNGDSTNQPASEAAAACAATPEAVSKAAAKPEA